MRHLILLVALLAAGPAFSQQLLVEYKWVQPDSTMGSMLETGEWVGKMAIPDGWISAYEVEVAAGADTTSFGMVQAPATIAAEGIAIVPVAFNVPTAIRVRAIDKDGRVSGYSPWSETFVVDPGPPVPPARPRVTRVFLGG